MPKKLTQEELISRYSSLWGSRYDYSKVEYVNRRTKVCITCPKHGDFWMPPLSHANGHGCPKCGNESHAKKLSKPLFDKDELLRRLEKVHGKDVFDYSLIRQDSFIYKGTKTRIPVICNQCGNIFFPIASEHLSGRGCNVCRLRRFSKVNVGRYKAKEDRVLVANVGIVDVDTLLYNDRIFTIWREMICRCYDEKRWKNHPTYENCEVCDDWKFFSNYQKWYKEHYVDGFFVDKDLLSLSIGRKLYSPETCCFLPSEINNVISVYRKRKKGDLPMGVHIVNGCIFSLQGNEYLGAFPTIEKARESYLKSKKEHIIELANKWKDKIEPRAYDALINIDVDRLFNNQ